MRIRKVLAVPLSTSVIVTAWLLLSQTTSAEQFSDWSAPQNLGPLVNSTTTEQHPALSPDGLSLYFVSDRPGGAGGTDLWASHRDRPTSAWQAPVPITALNSPSSEFAPGFDPTGRWLFFGSEREGGCGDRDLWVSYRSDKKDELAWKPPVNLGCGQLSWPGFDDGPTYFREDERDFGVLFFISDRPGGIGGRDVWMASHRDGGRFSAPVNVSELNSAADDTRPAVRSDGLEFVFGSLRTGSIPSGATLSNDLWSSSRASTSVAWSTPVNLVLLNTSATEGAPALSKDGTTMVFNSNRPGGQGGLDLWVTTRTKTN